MNRTPLRMTARRIAHVTTIVLLAALIPARAQAQEAPAEPLLDRIKMVTIAAPDVTKVETLYTKWLDYKVRDKGRVGADMARSWGAPKTAGRPFVVMSNDADPDVFIRAVESDAVKDYKPMTTWGWNAFELVIDDIDAVEARLKDSPFSVLGTRSPLKSAPSIVTMQVAGPGQEVLYMANETGDRAKSSLPAPGGLIGRTFIVILAGSDIEKVRDWYAGTFNMAKQAIRSSGGKVVPRALGLPEGTGLPISLLSLKQRGNRIQLDGYLDHGAGARPKPDGQLPPGNAMVSFSVKSLDAIAAPLIAPPAALGGAAYGKGRAATVVGPAGELIELIEE